MNISDLTVADLHAAILSLSLDRKHFIDLAFGLNEQYYKDRANSLEVVIQVLDSEIMKRCCCNEI